MSELFTHYSRYGPITDPGNQQDVFKDLPRALSELCRVVQGLLLHVLWAERYGIAPSEERKLEVNIRYVERILRKMQEIQSGPLTVARELEKRALGNCRTFSVLLTSILQHQGIPARARCGFGKYFVPGWHEDHWVCEYWNDSEERWILVDAQLDEFQIQELKVTFDPTDVPRDQFFVAGKAWSCCRDGEADPEKFGIFDMHGLWFIRGNLVRDVAALNKVELLPWDIWGLMDRQDGELSAAEMDLLDQVAAMTYDQVDFEGIRSVYKENRDLTVPSIIKSYSQSKMLLVDLTSEEIVE
jgi:hypothetical protein